VVAVEEVVVRPRQLRQVLGVELSLEVPPALANPGQEHVEPCLQVDDEVRLHHPRAEMLVYALVEGQLVRVERDRGEDPVLGEEVVAHGRLREQVLLEQILLLLEPAEQEEERRLVAPSEVEGVVTRAFRAHKAWAKTAVADRVALCERFCEEFEKDGERIAREVTLQMGKPLAQARGEVKTTVHRARTMMSLAPEALRDDPLPPLPGSIRFVRHEPVGLVRDISACNYPILIAVNVLVPAVLAGNALIL